MTESKGEMVVIDSVFRPREPTFLGMVAFPTYDDVVLSDPNGRDGEWHVVVSLPHEVVEWEGYGVPAFEGDVERIEWERGR